MEFSAPLRRLLEQYPLPGPGGITEVVDEPFRTGGLDLRMIGISADVPAFGEVSASAVGRDGGATLIRAFFELQERLAIVRAERAAVNQPERRWELRAWNGELAGSLASAELFPVAPRGATWVYSKSNGVAAHATHLRAASAGAYELVERDRVLRSWYGEFAPERWARAPLGSLELFREFYELNAYDFGQGVVGVVGLPKEPGRHLVLGLAGGPDRSSALEHAIQEALQRLAFLDEVPVPASAPEVCAQVDFHLDYFLYPQHLPRIRDWLEGRRVRAASGSAASGAGESGPRLDDIRFAEITPPGLAGRLVVVKAISAERVPLTFGAGNPSPCVATRAASDDLDFWVHPIA